MTKNIYNEIDEIITKLRNQHYEDFSHKISEAKRSGCMASEILGLTSLALQEYDKIIQQQDTDLKKDIGKSGCHHRIGFANASNWFELFFNSHSKTLTLSP